MTSDLVYGSWAQGFMAGWNYALFSEYHFYRDLGVKSADEENFHIRQYCDAHPLATFVEAVIDLWFTLPLKPQSN